MGIRPEKYIGWAISTDTKSVNTEQFEKLLKAKYSSTISPEYTYKKFYDFVKPYPAGERIEALGSYSASLDNYNILDYVDIVQSGVDGIEHDELYFVFYPMMLTPYAFPEGVDGTAEFRDDGSPFVMAELEKFFPEALETFRPCSYTMTTPVFPSDYAVLHKNPQNSIQGFDRLVDPTFYMDIYRVLRQLQRGEREKADQFVRLTKFKTAAELEEHFYLGPPDDLFMFAQFLNILDDESVPYTLTPRVVYAWR